MAKIRLSQAQRFARGICTDAISETYLQYVSDICAISRRVSRNQHELLHLSNNAPVGRVLCIEQQYRCAKTNEDSTMQMNKTSSAALAAAAAMLFSTALTTTTFAADEATVHCTGVNSCKGTSDCKSAKNSCKGQNSCKGTGWVSMSKSACADAQAKAKADASK
jgi:hypothetical protein